jgi:hypothetical protein
MEPFQSVGFSQPLNAEIRLPSNRGRHISFSENTNCLSSTTAKWISHQNKMLSSLSKHRALTLYNRVISSWALAQIMPKVGSHLITLTLTIKTFSNSLKQIRHSIETNRAPSWKQRLIWTQWFLTTLLLTDLRQELAETSKNLYRQCYWWKGFNTIK